MKTLPIGAVILGLLLALGGCGSSSSSSDNNKKKSAATLEIVGVSGGKVDMNGDWSRGCGNDQGVFMVDLRTFSGGDLTMVLSDYLTASDCSGDRDWHVDLAATLTSDQTVTITDWVDIDGVSATPPTGLEAIAEANGLTMTFTSGTLTPDTAAGADALNAQDSGAGYCGITDWAVGAEQDVLDCMLGGSSATFKTSWVVDDTVTDFTLYEDGEDGVVDADGYPTDMFNADPLVKQ